MRYIGNKSFLNSFLSNRNNRIINENSQIFTNINNLSNIDLLKDIKIYKYVFCKFMKHHK